MHPSKWVIDRYGIKSKAVGLASAAFLPIASFRQVSTAGGTHIYELSTNNIGNMSSDPHIFQGGWNYDLVSPDSARGLECSICLLPLRNPHRTSCAHLFCYSCIIAWLQQGKSYCPHDNSSLGEGRYTNTCIHCKFLPYENCGDWELRGLCRENLHFLWLRAVRITKKTYILCYE